MNYVVIKKNESRITDQMFEDTVVPLIAIIYKLLALMIMRIRKKSIYHCSYHNLNVISYLELKHNKQINNRDKIIKIFNLIDIVLPQVNNNNTSPFKNGN